MTKFITLSILTLTVLSVIICSCNDSNQDLVTDTDSEFVAEFSLLNGSSFVLNVNRRVDHPDVQFPFEELNESDYEKTDQSKQYKVKFSDNIKTITIMPDSIFGTLKKDTDKLKQYALEQGLFAGGRFIVWIIENRFEAEYTIYGSGVPIILSERGYLEPAD